MMKTADALALARSADPEVKSVKSVSQIATLWGGMGSIVRLQCGMETPGKSATMIAKRIRCSNPRSFGDKRKAASYQVEASFYGSEACRQLCEKHVCCRGLHTHDDGNGSITIMMTPLPNPSLHCMEGETAKAAVRSVARLHAYFWGNAKSTYAVEKIGLAAQGTYWYLDTRPDEYEFIDGRSGISRKLKKAARGIDRALKEHDYQTICHGDLKACNMSASKDPSYATFVDFQYLGRACPAKDLAYIFVCGMDVDEDFEERQEDELLRLYIDELAANGVGDDEDAPLPTLEKLKNAL
jgi:thiamine kinase-like enzyme